MWPCELQNHLGPQSQPQILLSLVNFLFYPTIQNLTTQKSAPELTAVSHTLSSWPCPSLAGKVPQIPEQSSAHLFPHSSVPYHFPLQRTGSPFLTWALDLNILDSLGASFHNSPHPSCISISWCLLESSNNLGNMIKFLLSPYHQNQILLLIQHPL